MKQKKGDLVRLYPTDLGKVEDVLEDGRLLVSLAQVRVIRGKVTNMAIVRLVSFYEIEEFVS